MRKEKKKSRGLANVKGVWMIIPCTCTAVITTVGFISCLFNEYFLNIYLVLGAGDAWINKIQSLLSWNLHSHVYWSTVGQGKKKFENDYLPSPITAQNTDARVACSISPFHALLLLTAKLLIVHDPTWQAFPPWVHAEDALLNNI